MTPTDRILAAAYSESVDIFKRLAKKLAKKDDLAGTIMSSRDDFGRTALHVAALGGRTHIVRYLVHELKLDVNLKDDGGDTPLHCAVQEKHVSIAAYLIDNGANLNAIDEDGVTALHLAAMEGHKQLLKLLISKGAEVDANPVVGTPLQLAAAKGKKASVKILLENNANPNISYFHTICPLALAIVNGSIECLKLLLKAGADPNDTSREWTPLDLAITKGGIPFLKCLLDAGANPNLTNHSGSTPVEVAAIMSYRDAVETLFPVTSPISDFPDWSVAGIMAHIHSKEMREKRKQKMCESLLKSKFMGNEAVKRMNFKDAIKWYTKAIGCNFDNNDEAAAVYSNRSICWLYLDEGHNALKDAYMALRLKPKWPKAFYRVGMAYMLLKEYEKAANAFNDGLELLPSNRDLVYAFREAVESQWSDMVERNQEDDNIVSI